MSDELQQTAYDLFATYSRRDNQPPAPGRVGAVTAFLAALQREHRATAAQDLNIYFDVEAIDPMARWEDRLEHALRASRLLLAFLSPDYFASAFCRREWQAYRETEHDRALAGEGVMPVLLRAAPPLAQPPPELADWVADLNQRQRIELGADAADPVAALEREDWRQRLRWLDLEIQARLAAVEADLAPRGFFYTPNSTFTGRTAELERLGRMVPPGSSGQVTVIHGPRKRGKTELAVKYGRSYAARYPGGLWIVSAAGCANAGTALRQLEHRLGVEIPPQRTDDPRPVVAAILGGLYRKTAEGVAAAQARRPALPAPAPACLLVFDNVDDPGFLAGEEWRSAAAEPWLHIVATTNLDATTLPSPHRRLAWLELGPLAGEDAVRLLRRHQPGERFASPEEEQAARTVAELLGGEPLDLLQAATHLGAHVDESFALLRDELQAGGSRAGMAPDVYARLVERSLARLPAAYRRALEYAALLPGDFIPVEWIETLVGDEFEEFELAARPGEPEPWALLVARLRGLRLWLPGGEAHLVRMHPALQERIRTNLDMEETHRRAKLVGHALRRMEWAAKHWLDPQARWEFDPLLAFCHHLFREPTGLGAPRLATPLGETLIQLGRYREAATLLGEAREVLERQIEPEPAEKERMLNAHGRALNQCAEFAAAEPILREACFLAERHFAPNSTVLASSLNNLAQLLKATNRLAEAEPLLRRALAIFEASYGPEHPAVATALNNLAQVLLATNRLAEAEPLMRRALVIFEASSGPEHPDVAIALVSLAQLTKATNRLAEAEPLMRRALAIFEAGSGPDHPNVARNLNSLSLLLQDTNRLAEAEPLMRRALAIDEASYGPEHPNVATDLNNLAQLMQATNRLAEAEPLMRRALASDEASYGPEHPNVARDLNNLAQLMQVTNRLAEAEPLMRRALASDEASYGPEHPDVARDLNNLTLLMQATNRLAEAEPLMRRALTILVSCLGLDHPSTKTACANYVSLLEAMGLDRAAILAKFREIGIEVSDHGPE